MSRGTNLESNGRGSLSGKADDGFSSLSGPAATGTGSVACTDGPITLIGSEVSSLVLDAGVRFSDISDASDDNVVSGAAVVNGKSSMSGVGGAGSC